MNGTRGPRRPARLWLCAVTVVTLLGGLAAQPTAHAATTASATGGWVSNPAGLVNPLIGTASSCALASCEGLDVPGAYLPFGMLQWGPVTTSGGYSYDDSTTLGYALTSVSGCGGGCAAASNIPILPTVGAVGNDPSAASEPMDHTQEAAAPGYYKLTAGGVTTQLTGTTRAGIATFRFPATTSANLLLQLGHSSPVATQFTVLSDDEITGSITRSFDNPSTAPNPNPQYTMYFDMVFNHDFSSWGTWHKSSAPNTEQASPGMGAQPGVSDAAGAMVTFDTDSQNSVEAKVAISYVSTANAQLNLRTEIPGWNFAAVKAAARQTWDDMLDKIQVTGGTPAQQTVFYTALYHSLLFPSVFSDVNGQYWGWDGKVHTVAPGHAAYANFSGWDVYRSDIQLEAMLAPHQVSDIVSSMLADYAQTGQLPQWAADDMERYIMIGDPADAIIADAYAFGARDFDASTALADMIRQATVPGVMRPGLEQYETAGYIPYDGGPYSCCNFRGVVSAQLEYDTDDYAIAELAQSLGDGKAAATFAARAQNWQNSFDPATGFFEPKAADGQFRSADTPTVSYGASGFFDTDNIAFFADGTKYVYTPMVPFDLHGIIAAEGGDDAWISYLDALSSNITGNGPTQVEMTNEPSTDIPWEYDYAGEPYKTQELVREIQDQLYTDQPGGMPGNDDQGELSSWYVWSALGLYPETPGSATLVLGSPLFSGIAVHMGNGTTIVEHAPEAADDAPYVQGLTVNGEPWNRAYLPASAISGSGPSRTVTLDWRLGTVPDTSWAAAGDSAPPSDTSGLLPALGYLGTGEDSESLFVRPGSATVLELGVQSMADTTGRVEWTASVPAGSGLTVTPAGGTITAGAEARATQPITLAAASAPGHGEYQVTFQLRTANGTRLPDVVAEVGVDPVYNGTGISADTAQSAADFDGNGYSYSEQELTAVGLAPGASVTASGLTYTWPDVAAGTPDNVLAAGQTIGVTVPAGATTLGFLGAASNGAESGTMTITYTDGSTQTATLGFGDWNSGAAYGNDTVAVMPYRNWATGTSETIATRVYATSVALEPGKTVASVTLPAQPGGQGDLHIFAMGSDAGPVIMG